MDKKPYKVYELLTNELLGSYDYYYEAHEAHGDKPITIIYRPSKRKKK